MNACQTILRGARETGDCVIGDFHFPVGLGLSTCSVFFSFLSVTTLV